MKVLHLISGGDTGGAKAHDTRYVFCARTSVSLLRPAVDKGTGL